MNKLRNLIVASIFVSCGAYAATGTQRFESFEVHRHDGVGPSFNYSSAAATSSDPVVITVVGRTMTSKDRQFRTDLQRNWLSTEVPKVFVFVGRDQVECALVRTHEWPLCDRYSYVDPGTHVRHDYYFYLGNWPD